MVDWFGNEIHYHCHRSNVIGKVVVGEKTVAKQLKKRHDVNFDGVLMIGGDFGMGADEQGLRSLLGALQNWNACSGH